MLPNIRRTKFPTHAQAREPKRLVRSRLRHWKHILTLLEFLLCFQIVGGGKELTVPQYYAAGSLAAIPISIVEAPVDLFKIKLQAQVRESE